jgi:phage terminase small subunit|tara:strand:- start:117 stop:482 length:366 start_codon:yes stop_codon:yes gene_type:complete
MSEKMDMFVEFYSLTGNATKAAIHAGYSEKTAKQQGYRLKNQLQDRIEERVKKILIQKVPAVLNWVTDLAESAQSEAVRLGAIKDILDRAGMKPVERVEQTNIEKLSTEELERELSSLLKH